MCRFVHTLLNMNVRALAEHTVLSLLRRVLNIDVISFTLTSFISDWTDSLTGQLVSPLAANPFPSTVGRQTHKNGPVDPERERCAPGGRRRLRPLPVPPTLYRQPRRIGWVSLYHRLSWLYHASRTCIVYHVSPDVCAPLVSASVASVGSVVTTPILF